MVFVFIMLLSELRVQLDPQDLMQQHGVRCVLLSKEILMIFVKHWLVLLEDYAQLFVDPSSLTAYVACQLIALDKCPGVRPIGIGETAHRVIAKAVLSLIRNDIQQAAGSLQLCAGQFSGCEAAVHFTREIFPPLMLMQ